MRGLVDSLLRLIAVIAAGVAGVFALTKAIDDHADDEEPEGQEEYGQSGRQRGPQTHRPMPEESRQPLRPGWSLPRPEHVATPNYWPAVMAFGITFMLWGVATTFLVSGVGLLLFAISLAGWISELRKEAR